MGCGMLLCKKVLTEKATVSGAIDYLREIGSEPTQYRSLSQLRTLA